MFPDNLSDIQNQLRSGTFTLMDLVGKYIEQANDFEHLNVYVELFAEEALDRAKVLQAKIDRGEPTGQLIGLVCSTKDVICYKDHRISAGSKMLKDFKSTFSATAIERILEQDAIIIGRTNCDEFAMGSDNTNSYYGATRNAQDDRLVPGGSSGGAAVSVQTGSCLVALGSDTGGSVRQPAAFCGLLGFKPSHGRISRHGLIAYASSFDQIGVIGHQIEDIQKVYEVIHGPDEFDSTLLQDAPDLSEMTNQHHRFGILGETLTHPSLDPAIKKSVQKYIEGIENMGHDVKNVTFEHLDYVIPAYYILTSAEASSNLSRYDGIRYGHRSDGAKNLTDVYRQSRTEGFGAEVKRRILLGTFVLSEGYYDDYYAKAQKIRRLIIDQINQIFKEVDFVLLPTSPVLPWKIGSTMSPVDMYLADIYSVIANLAGIPGISIPLSIEGHKMSTGLQILAPRWHEAQLLDVAKLLWSGVDRI